MATGYKNGGGNQEQPYNEDNGRYEKGSKSSAKSRDLKSDIANQNYPLSKKEYRLWCDAIGEIEQGKRYEISQNGKTYIPIGNKMLVTSGTYVKPILEDVLEFESQADLDVFLVMLSLEN